MMNPLAMPRPTTVELQKRLEDLTATWLESAKEFEKAHEIERAATRESTAWKNRRNNAYKDVVAAREALDKAMGADDAR